jgi:MFS family permease
MTLPKKQDHSRFAANIPRYFSYRALRGLSHGLITAMWVIYLQQRHGLNLTQVALVDVAFWLAAAFGEVPTGVVADTFSRKASLMVGAALMGVSMLAWTFAPTVFIITLSYIFLAIGATFLSGAEDALFYESVKISGRADEYTRLAGWASAITLGAVALGNLASGLLAMVDLRLPFLSAGLALLFTLGIVLTFKEPRTEEKEGGQARQGYGEILRQSMALMWARPTLSYPIMYLSLVPIAAVLMETVFLQPQAVLLGVPLAGIGIIVMAVQFTNIAGSTWAHRLKRHVGEGYVLYTAPAFIILSLILLAAFQIVPALLFIGVIGFFTALIRPLVLSRIQDEVPNDIRATILSMQALLFTLLVAVVELTVGFIADQAGLPTAYLGLAGGLSLVILFLFWKSRQHFPQAAVSN